MHDVGRRNKSRCAIDAVFWVQISREFSRHDQTKQNSFNSTSHTGSETNSVSDVVSAPVRRVEPRAAALMQVPLPDEMAPTDGVSTAPGGFIVEVKI